MKLNDIINKVNEIEKISDDDEMAHAREDELYQEAIHFIAGGGILTVEMAREILKTDKIKFARWCA